MIKPRLLLIVVFVLTMQSGISQKVSTWEYGIEAGPGIASLRGNDVIKKYHKTRFSYAAGLFLRYNFNQLLSLHVAVDYENKGSRIEGAVFDSTGTPIGVSKGRTIIQYITMPLLVRATFGRKRIFFVNTGPYIAYLLKNESKFSGGQAYSIDNTKNFKKLDLGISIGCGISIPFSNQFNFSIEARDNLGLMNTSSVPVYNNGEIKNNSFNLLLGLSYKPGTQK